MLLPCWQVQALEAHQFHLAAAKLDLLAYHDISLKKNTSNLVGGFKHLEKYEFVNGKDDIPYIMENKIHVPNHQPVSGYSQNNS